MPEKNSKKTGAGRFRPGESGNPRGRPPGSRNRATLLAQNLLDGDAEGIVDKLIKRAKSGHPAALKLCIERLVPRRRDGAVEFALPAIRKAEDLAEAMAAVIEAAAAGLLTLDEAHAFSSLLERQRRMIETAELQLRLEVVEKALKDDDKPKGRYGL